MACALSCAKKSGAPEQNPAPPPAPTNSAAESPATNTVPTNSVAVIEPVPAVTNAPVPAAQEITNPPPAETTVTAPETAPMTATNLPGHVEVVEMPTNPPVAPTNFFPGRHGHELLFLPDPGALRRQHQLFPGPPRRL